MHAQRGFTLVELMTVIAIIGVLSALAVVAYDDYMTRSQVAEALELGGGLKGPLAEYGANTNSWPSLVHSSATATPSQITATLAGLYASVDPSIVGVYPQGRLTVQITRGRAAGKDMAFSTLDGGNTWNCSGAFTTISSRHRPQACR